MLTKICPICDQKLDHMNYCSVCRKWIRKPNYIKVDYYLNERHPQEWHDCEYHGRAEEVSEIGPAKAHESFQEQKAYGKAEVRENKTVYEKKGKAGKAQASEKKKSSNKGCLPWLVAGFVFLQIGLPLLFSAADRIGDILDERLLTTIPETAASAEEVALEELSQTQLTDSQVMELGQECDASHMELPGEDTAEKLLETLSEHYYLVESSQTSTNLLDHSEFGDFKWFQTNREMYFESREDSERRITMNVSWDTFSNRVHEIGFHADEEDVGPAAKAVFGLLTEYGVLTEKPESADSWEIFFENSAASMEEDYLWAEDSALEASELGMSLSYSEYDGKRRYYINVWSEADE